LYRKWDISTNDRRHLPELPDNTENVAWKDMARVEGEDGGDVAAR